MQSSQYHRIAEECLRNTKGVERSRRDVRRKSTSDSRGISESPWTTHGYILHPVRPNYQRSLADHRIDIYWVYTDHWHIAILPQDGTGLH